MPVGKIVGEFVIDGILSGSPQDIWEETKLSSGVQKAFYEHYFKGKEIGYAIKIGDFNLYKEPVDPKRVFKSFTAPQSFVYLDDNIKISVPD